jgi:hypothetical protein
MEDYSESFGYYYVTVRQVGPGRLLQTNNERAFIITQLQDLFSPRPLPADIPSYKQLASCVDLLAFSVRGASINLLVFTIDKSIITDCIEHLLRRLIQYQQEYGSSRTPRTRATLPSVRLQKLAGPHQALAKSIDIHLLHEDWEFDRYSSIGFYLHDRRGDWMRTWRLTELYENNIDHYALLIRHATSRSAQSNPTDLQIVA